MIVYIDHEPFCCVFTHAEGLAFLHSRGLLNARGCSVIDIRRVYPNSRTRQ